MNLFKSKRERLELERAGLTAQLDVLRCNINRAASIVPQWVNREMRLADEIARLEYQLRKGETK